MSDRLSKALERLGRAVDDLRQYVVQEPVPALRSNEAYLIAGIERLTKVMAASVSTPPQIPESPCISCTLRESCKHPCNRLTDILPGVYEGRGRREHLCGLRPDLDSDDRRDSITDCYEILLGVCHYFTPKQWEIIQLYYRDGKTEAQIATLLNLSPSAVSERLTRAKERIQRCGMRNSPKKSE